MSKVLGFGKQNVLAASMQFDIVFLCLFWQLTERPVKLTGNQKG